MKNYRRGWFNESARHSLAAKGIKTKPLSGFSKRNLANVAYSFSLLKNEDDYDKALKDVRKENRLLKQQNLDYDLVAEGKLKSLTKYYSTSSPMTMQQFIDTEVKERGNYTLDEVKGWMEKYGLKPSSPVLWVATEPWIAWRYGEVAEKWDDIPYLKGRAKKNMENIDSYEVYQDKIIKESDDGDDGYLMIT